MEKHIFGNLCSSLKRLNIRFLGGRVTKSGKNFVKDEIERVFLVKKSFFCEEEFLHSMRRKKSEGFFDGSLFVIFAAEKEEETWFKWGHEKYNSLGMVTIKAEVNDSFSSVVRPGFFGVKNTTILQGDNVPINKVAFYSRDYCMLAQPGETIQVCGMLEKVTPKQGEPYHRVVVGYFDAYLDERREKEYIKVIK